MTGAPVRLWLFPCLQNSLGDFPEANCGRDRANPDYEAISDLGEKFYLGDTPNFEAQILADDDRHHATPADRAIFGGIDLDSGTQEFSIQCERSILLWRIGYLSMQNLAMGDLAMFNALTVRISLSAFGGDC
jgi:hypothetical protein